MGMNKIILQNKDMSITFVETSLGVFRPEWIREKTRPMLRFKDHEWLNVGGTRVTEGALVLQNERELRFSGTVVYGQSEIAWQVDVLVPEDGGEGFTVKSRILPTEEVELLEGLTAFETPYEYESNDEDRMTVISQQPVYTSHNNEVIGDAGFRQPLWYYAPPTLAHLTYPSSTPLMYNKISNADGSNVRHTVIMGNWDNTTVKDIYVLPTRSGFGRSNNEVVFHYDAENIRTSKSARGMKFMVGTLNWHTSLHKDPNMLIGREGISQEVTIVTKGELDTTYDALLAESWSRVIAAHLPQNGVLEAYNIYRDKGISWLNATEWLKERIENPDTDPIIYSAEKKTICYTENTRPRPQSGNTSFMPSTTGQLTGPFAYIGKIWGDNEYTEISDKLMVDFHEALKGYSPNRTATIGWAPMILGMLRKGQLNGFPAEIKSELIRVISERNDYILNPIEGKPVPDSGSKAFDAANTLLAGKIFGDEKLVADGIAMIDGVNELLDGNFWNFNCATVGDLVGAGQARPFGHTIAITANIFAHELTGKAEYLKNAKRFADLASSMHFIAYNESPAVDLDTRGWAHGSTGGRDQTAQMPPWETGLALQQFALLMERGEARDSIYDIYWYFAKNGLGQFPKARILKRGYRHVKNVWEVCYRPVETLATERDFYLNYAYLAYENPWDQTMLALYQGAEPVIQSMLFGDGLVYAKNAKVQTIIPAVANYDASVKDSFVLHIWNPLNHAQTTDLVAVISEKTGNAYSYVADGISGTVNAENSLITNVVVPPRQALKIKFLRS